MDSDNSVESVVDTVETSQDESTQLYQSLQDYARIVRAGKSVPIFFKILK